MSPNILTPAHDPNYYAIRPGRDLAFTLARHHAVTCKRCSLPIIDVDGHPCDDYYANPCPVGLRLLLAYAVAV